MSLWTIFTSITLEHLFTFNDNISLSSYIKYEPEFPSVGYYRNKSSKIYFLIKKSHGNHLFMQDSCLEGIRGGKE